MRKLYLILAIAIIILPQVSFSQSAFETTFEAQMVEYEHEVVRIYNELQRFLNEPSYNKFEQEGFEKLLDIYVDRILEIYNTMTRLSGSTLETYRGVTARSLVFRSLTYLERSHESAEHYEKACEDYKRALELYKQKSNLPIMNKMLPYEVWIGNKMYTRLADLLDNKSKGFDLLETIK